MRVRIKLITILIIVYYSCIFSLNIKNYDTLAPESTLLNNEIYQGIKIIQLEKTKEVWVKRDSGQTEYKPWHLFEIQFFGKSYQKLLDFAVSEHQRYFGTAIGKQKPTHIPGLSANELKALFAKDKEKIDQLIRQYQDLSNTETQLPPRVFLIPEDLWNTMEPKIVVDDQNFSFGDSVGGINETSPWIINPEVKNSITDDEYILINPGVLARIPLVIDGKRYYMFQLGIRRIAKQGKIFYKPFGGHIGFTKKFIPLAKKWGIKDITGKPIEEEGDISFLIPKKNLKEFRELYRNDILERKFVYFEDPALSMHREIIEELGDNSNYDGITALDKNELQSIPYTNQFIVMAKLQKLITTATNNNNSLDFIHNIISLKSADQAAPSLLKQLVDIENYVAGPYKIPVVYDLPEYAIVLNFEKSSLLEKEADLLIREGIIRPEQKHELIEKVISLRDEVLNIKVSTNKRLEDTLTQFAHNLLVIQLFKLVVFGDPQTEQYNPHRYRNEKSNQIALLLQEPNLSFKQQLLRTLRTFELLKYLSDDEIFTKSATQLADELRYKLNNFDKIVLDVDAFDTYEKDIINANSPKKVAVTMDDNGEAVFLLRMLMDQMKTNPNLSFVLIPRGGQFRNDVSAKDIAKIIGDPYFSDLQQFLKEKRLTIVSDGPLFAGIDLSKLSKESALALQKADYVLSIGETNFECLNGLKKNTFHIFSVYSGESSALTGLPKGSSVFAYIPAGLNYFNDFSQKAFRKLEYNNMSGKPYIYEQYQSANLSISVAGKTLMDVIQDIPQNRVRTLPESKKLTDKPKIQNNTLTVLDSLYRAA